MHVQFVRSFCSFTQSYSAALSADQESASLEFASEAIAVGPRQGSKAELEGIGPVETDFGHTDRPTLAKPTLAKVKVLVACEDFGFWELFVF